MPQEGSAGSSPESPGTIPRSSYHSRGGSLRDIGTKTDATDSQVYLELKCSLAGYAVVETNG